MGETMDRGGFTDTRHSLLFSFFALHAAEHIAYGDDDVRHVTVLGNDLESLYCLRVSNDIVQQDRTVFLHP
jgi:hypothetical protein